MRRSSEIAGGHVCRYKLDGTVALPSLADERQKGGGGLDRAI